MHLWNTYDHFSLFHPLTLNVFLDLCDVKVTNTVIIITVAQVRAKICYRSMFFILVCNTSTTQSQIKTFPVYFHETNVFLTSDLWVIILGFFFFCLSIFTRTNGDRMRYCMSFAKLWQGLPVTLSLWCTRMLSYNWM